ncbi:helix-turn-helix domain-containing protein [Rothia nasisuis]|uniref:helix-turn-helix domain-containing protein n=2 Tax=Micrococcaceae TaxID=1268 RepID=UPI0034E03140
METRMLVEIASSMFMKHRLRYFNVMHNKIYVFSIYLLHVSIGFFSPRCRIIFMETTTLTADIALAAEVRAWMGRRQVTQTKLGKILGVPQASIYRRLKGEISFSFNELLIIASYFGITVAELVGSALLNAKSPAPLQVSQEGRAKKKIAPVELVPSGATYQVVAGAGFEPAASGL